MITLARLQHVTISQAFMLVKVLHINKRGVFIGGIVTRRHDMQTTSTMVLYTIGENNNAKKQITKYWYFVTLSKVQLKCTSLQVKVLFWGCTLSQV